MNTRHLLAITVIVAAGFMLAGCRGRDAVNPNQNIFYNFTSQADSFGFSEVTFNQMQAAFHVYQPTDFKSKFYYYRYGCGYYHVNKKDEVTALKYADSMLLVVKENGNPATDQKEIAIANLSKGDMLFSLKRYSEACDYYYMGKVAAEKSSDAYTLSEYSYRLGMAMYRNENYSAAAMYFIDAFEKSGHRKNSFAEFYRRQEVLNNIALSYLHANNPDSAIWYANKGIGYLTKNEHIYDADKDKLIAVAKGVQYGTLGRAYLLQHKIEGATLLQKSIDINATSAGDKGNALQIQGELAKHYLDTTFPIQPAKAYDVLMAMKKGLDTLHDKEVAILWNELMSRYYAVQGNKGEAYTYLAQHHALQIHQIDANKMLAEANIASRLKEMQNSYDLSLLQNKSQHKTVYLIIAVLVCLLTGIILFLIVRSWKKEKENSRKLAVLHKQVQQQKIQLEATVKQLDQQIKTKDYILGVIAHDLRNPISAISTLTRIVNEEYENEEDNKEFLEMAQSACKDSLAMIDSIMQLSQQGSPEILKKRIVDINETVLDSVEMMRLKAGEKQQEIVLHPTGTPLYTLADSDKISRVVSNLVMNAIKFSFPNSTIDVYIKDKYNNVEIEVKDEGIGIPADLQSKVFDVFTEAKRRGTSKESTFGLGLSICKQLVEAHDGKIWLESKEGLGSAFHIQLHKHAVPQPKYEAEEILHG